MRKLRWLAMLGAFWAAPAVADVPCRDQIHDGNRYTVCTVDMHSDALRLFLTDDEGRVLGGFGAVDDMLAQQGRRLGFAMNAGMYHPDRRPVGHYVENGVETRRLVTRAGPGNFGLLPNGVFCIRDGRADVIESLRYERERPTCIHATQSGPMLVIDGALHPRFLPDSTSRYIRNGVGTSADGSRALFVISNTTVTFHQFGRFFRDALGLPNALYFDGNISRLHAPSLGRSDGGFPMGPIVGVTRAVP